MTILKRFTTLVITLSICVGAVWAGDVEDADAALLKKDFGFLAYPGFLECLDFLAFLDYPGNLDYR